MADWLRGMAVGDWYQAASLGDEPFEVVAVDVENEVVLVQVLHFVCEHLDLCGTFNDIVVYSVVVDYGYLEILTILVKSRCIDFVDKDLVDLVGIWQCIKFVVTPSLYLVS